MRIAAIALAAVLCAGCTTATEEGGRRAVATWRSIQSWSGRGDAQLATFPTGGGPLRFHWQAVSHENASSGKFRIRLHSADSGRALADVADQQGGGDGRTDIIDDHQRFYLSVEAADFDWSIRVEEAITPSR